ncbi:MAG: hypothetical protein NZ551_00330 [Microscillaceae bacterium]|nr:hypothetical protein [Microscillaceae bacterium]MDW8459635.1 hypothetical protein [Cytophagales bacterium]
MRLKIILLASSFFSFSFGYSQLFIKVHYNLLLKDDKGQVVDVQNPVVLANGAQLVAESTEESVDEEMQKVTYEILRTEVSQYRNGAVVEKKKLNSNHIPFKEFNIEKGDKFNIKVTGLKQTNIKGISRELKMEEINPKEIKMFVLKLVWGE